MRQTRFILNSYYLTKAGSEIYITAEGLIQPTFKSLDARKFIE